MKDFDEPFELLDMVLGAKFYVGNVIQNSIDGSEIKYSEALVDPLYAENTGTVKDVNSYADFLMPAPLTKRSHLQ